MPLPSSGFPHLVSILSDNSKLQLAPSIRSHKLWCKARALLAPVSLATKMLASKLIPYFSSHPAVLDSSPLHHQITSPWLLPMRRLIRIYQMFRPVLVLLLMLLLTQSNWSLASELPLLILFPLYLIQREALYLCLKCMNCFSRFMIFWRMLVPNELGTQLIF